jgi:hypothetical protein
MEERESKMRAVPEIGWEQKTKKQKKNKKSEKRRAERQS